MTSTPSVSQMVGRILEQAGKPLTADDLRKRMLRGLGSGGGNSVPDLTTVRRILHRREESFRQLADGRWCNGRGRPGGADRA